MSKTTDWLPGRREDILAMTNTWVHVLLGSNPPPWGVPLAEAEALKDLETQAAYILNQARSSDRTPVITAKCRADFVRLEEKMRYIKSHYFLSPPLTDADFVSLELKPHDSTHTPSGNPAAQVTVDSYLRGRHELGIQIVYVTGSPDDPANKGYRIWYSVAAPGETPPGNPEELRKSFFTRRRKDVIEFEFGDSGKTVYMAVQIENDGKKGPWGPLTSAIIP